MKIQLMKLSIENFKGIKQLEIDFEGRNANIYGTNGTGKTTIYDAFLWLLFDKDSAGRKDFSAKPLNSDGKLTGKGIDVSVEAVLDIDGTNIFLKKVYSEKWTRKTGQVAKEFTGHTTEYLVNSVPTSKTKYNEYISSMIPESTFRLLTNTGYFHTGLKWQERRAILFELCGGVEEAEILNRFPELKDLENLLVNHTADEMKKIVFQRRRKLNEELEILPERIDEANRSLTGELKNTEECEKELERLEEQKTQMQCSFGRSNQEQLIEVRREIENMQQKRSALEATNRAYKAEQQTEWRRMEIERMRPAQKKHERLSEEKMNVVWELEKAKMELEEEQRLLLELREIWQKVQRQKWQRETTCPTCGQNLPQEEIQKAKQRYEADKKQKLQGLETQGKQTTEKLQRLEKQTNRLETLLTSLEEQLKNCTQIERFPEPEPKDKPGYAEEKQMLDTQLERMQQLEKEIWAGAEEEKTRQAESLASIEAAIREKKTVLLSAEMNHKQRMRIQELEECLKMAAENLEETERQLFLLDEYTRKQVELTEEKINQRFRMTKFKLFENLINEGIKEICVATHNGVPYPDLNNAMKVNCGLDIIHTLSEFYGVQVPIFIDNAESVVKLETVNTQFIRLIVSEADKTLRIEPAALEETIKNIA